jgi:hypothetical protein
MESMEKIKSFLIRRRLAVLLGTLILVGSVASLFYPGMQGLLGMADPSATKAATPIAGLSGAQYGDFVIFGKYEQDNILSNGKEPITWRVMKVRDGQALLISDKNLDCRLYDVHTLSNKYWGNCDLRTWLNDSFVKTAFTVEEESGVVLTTVVNSPNPTYGTGGGGTTNDKVFLFSLSESETFFPTDASRISLTTPYARARGAGIGTGTWWLRSPGYSEGSAAFVTNEGSDARWENQDNMFAVRPAIWLNLTSPGMLLKGEPAPSPTPGLSDAKAGDTVLFGRYQQQSYSKGGTEMISWRVLEVKGLHALLISDKNLNCQPYNYFARSATWESSTLRTWLNKDFMNEAFNRSEAGSVVQTWIENPDNPTYGTEGGNTTYDKVFLLSFAEANRFFPTDESRIGLDTFYADTRLTAGRFAYRQWWLRSIGSSQYNALFVDLKGSIDAIGASMHIVYRYVRPVIWLDLTAKDTAVLVNPNPTPTLAPAKAGDTVTFGRYEQDADAANGTEPVSWRILEVSGEKALLISDMNLDSKVYSPYMNATTWAQCSLRTWLNGSFMIAAFSTKEASCIVQTVITNPDSPTFGTPGGAETSDKVFLLSYAEAGKYFPTDESRIGRNSAYALAQKASTTHWWLRSPGFDHSWALYVGLDGRIDVNGKPARSSGIAVRPAIWVNLESGGFRPSTEGG